MCVFKKYYNQNNLSQSWGPVHIFFPFKVKCTLPKNQESSTGVAKFQRTRGKHLGFASRITVVVSTQLQSGSAQEAIDNKYVVGVAVFQ